MNVKYDFSGDIAVVVGASTGIGRATALAFAKAGAVVAVCDFNEEAGKETVKLAIEAGAEKASFYKVDVTDSDSVNAMKDKVIADYGRVDCLFSNAGISARGDQLGPPLTGVSVDEFKRLMEVNFFGFIRVSQAFLETFMKQKHGRIVVTASISAHMPSVMMPQYSTSKRAVINMAQTLAKELGPYGVTVNILNPGFVYTPMYENGGLNIKNKYPERFEQAKTAEDVMLQLASQSAFKRPQQPEDMANVVLWLCSDGSKEITGQEFNVDSGIIRR